MASFASSATTCGARKHACIKKNISAGWKWKWRGGWHRGGSSTCWRGSFVHMQIILNLKNLIQAKKEMTTYWSQCSWAVNWWLCWEQLTSIWRQMRYALKWGPIRKNCKWVSFLRALLFTHFVGSKETYFLYFTLVCSRLWVFFSFLIWLRTPSMDQP